MVGCSRSPSQQTVIENEFDYGSVEIHQHLHTNDKLLLLPEDIKSLLSFLKAVANILTTDGLVLILLAVGYFP